MRKNTLTPLQVFISICLIQAILFLVYAFFNGNHALLWYIQENKPSILGVDYSIHVIFSMNPAHLYESTGVTTGCFPPLAYIFYHFFHKLSMPENSGLLEGVDFTNLLSIPNYLYIYIIYSILIGVLLFQAMSLTYKKSSNSLRFLLLFLSIFASPIFAGSGFYVGNSTLLVLSLLLIALYCREQDSPYLQELALILIAFCVGFKLYPAVFGFLYIKEKKYKQTLRLFLYGCAFLFIPFVFFGGFNGLYHWAFNVAATMRVKDLGRMQYIKGVVFTTLSYLFHNFDSPIIKVISDLSAYAFLVSMILLGLKSKSKPNTIFYFTVAMIFFPSNSFRYTLSYLLIPFIHWLNTLDEKPYQVLNYLKSFLFAQVFAIPTGGGILTSFKIFNTYPPFNFVETWIYVSAYSLTILTTIYEIYKKKGFNYEKVH